MAEEDIKKARLYNEFYSIAENKALLDSVDFENRIKYFRLFRKFYESRIYGTDFNGEVCISSDA